MNKRMLKILLPLLLSLAAMVSLSTYYGRIYSKSNSVKAEVASDDIYLIRKDLHKIGCSEKITNIYINAIEQYSKKYSISPLLVYAIIKIESDYRLDARHSPIKLHVKGKPVTTRAHGISAVIWEFWSDSLKHRDIAHSYMELYLPDVSIEASAYILRTISNQEKSKGRYNLVEKVISRYYGAYSEEYINRFRKVTSDLMLDRIEETI